MGLLNKLTSLVNSDDVVREVDYEKEEDFEDRFLSSVDEEFKRKQADYAVKPEDYSKEPTFSSSVVKGHVEDILETLSIPLSYEISRDVLMPEDLVGLHFDLEAPAGYDRSSVDNFREQVRATVAFYVDLLKQRNAHVAKLATVVDKLQVDVNNLKFQNEASPGINITTSGDPELENKLMEAKLEIKSLKEKLTAANSPEEFTSKMRTLESKYASSLMEIERLKKEIDDLRVEQSLKEDLDINSYEDTHTGRVQHFDGLPDLIEDSSWEKGDVNIEVKAPEPKLDFDPLLLGDSSSDGLPPLASLPTSVDTSGFFDGEEGGGFIPEALRNPPAYEDEEPVTFFN